MEVEDEAPLVETIPNVIRVAPEGSVSLKCNILKGNPLTTQIIWTRNDNKIVADEVTYVMVSLIISGGWQRTIRVQIVTN